MDQITNWFHILKNAKTFEDIVAVLRTDFRLPVIREYPERLSLMQRCEMLAEDWVKLQYVERWIPRGAVLDQEVVGNITCTARLFYAILLAGDVKPLYLMTQEASDFVKATAFTQELEPQYFRETFEKPLVVYAGEPKTLFDDVLCVTLFYNRDEDELECLVSCVAGNGKTQTQEFARSIPVSDLVGTFKQDILAQDELGESTLYMIQQGIIDDANDLNNKFFKAIRYALTFMLLKAAEKRPIIVERQYRKGNNAAKQAQIFGKLEKLKVSLTTYYRYVMVGKASGERVALDKEGKTLKAIEVRGFVRRQHYGPANSQVKVIFINAHESHAWKKEGIRIITVVK